MKNHAESDTKPLASNDQVLLERTIRIILSGKMVESSGDNSHECLRSHGRKRTSGWYSRESNNEMGSFEPRRSWFFLWRFVEDFRKLVVGVVDHAASSLVLLKHGHRFFAAKVLSDQYPSCF